MTRLWVYTEVRNATFLLNFEFPQSAGPSAPLQVQSWSAEEVQGLGMAAMAAAMQALVMRERPDAVVFSRYVKPFALELMQQCRALGLPCLMHLDDLLLEVPLDLGDKYRAAYGPEFQALLAACLAGCDGVLSSTPFLREALLPHVAGKPVAVLAGVCRVPDGQLPAAGLRHQLARRRRQLARLRSRTLGYMGSSSHERDLRTIAPELMTLLREDPRLHFETLGLSPPPELKAAFPDRVRQYGFSRDYAGFLGSLYELAWDIGLAPLVPDRFNAAKTCTKFVEYATCGIPVLARAMQPYAALPSTVISLAEPGLWVPAIRALLADGAGRRRQAAAATDFVRQHHMASHAAARMVQAVQECLGALKPAAG